ncbi:MAG: alanine--tRNA ligase [Deltaproteobacteria bacterium]|jgi:alanyl-tRNA synthetase|nr:alanine--tRNA ligase [Deltaproteobacteria bacterium]
MLSRDIRNTFLTFFERHGHKRLASSSLVPRDDPSLLFTNAGMVQFKRLFTGEEKRDYKRAATSQKCVRAGGKHNDLENVGYTARHHTFFEMLGNFSFGDYFKKEAVIFAWELLTEGFKLPADKLYATVYQDDDEAFSLWEKEIGLPAERVSRLGEKDNFWAMGDTGPCGPCSEILIDQGPELGCGKPDCAPGCDCDRYLEIWNLVFMQFERNGEGALSPLPRPSIDTGLGLERLAAVTQGVYNNFESDLFRPLLDKISSLSGVPYVYGEALKESDPRFQKNVSLRVAADHARAVTFLVSDGVRPENLGRGYVLRRILRRAVRHGRKLGLKNPFMADMADAVMESLGDAYPELLSSADYIKKIVTAEEERFRETLDSGLKILNEAMGEILARGGKVVSGDLVFKLYDTYGFPVDLVADMAREENLTIDEAGFEAAMAGQKAKGRAAWKKEESSDTLLELVSALTSEGFQTEFLGYDVHSSWEKPSLIYHEGESRSSLSLSAGGEPLELTLVFKRSPFYAASGGQETDEGVIRFPGGMVVVDSVEKAPGTAVFLHHGRLTEGSVSLNEEARLEVDSVKRQATANNHSATHLLHKALRKTLGAHARQAGSSVSSERLRFDFTHFQALTREELEEIERLVNQDIEADHPVETTLMDMDEAVRSGAMALFEERYGERVRVVSMGDSRELCGGTHTQSTGRVGIFLISSESSVSSGVRRIEALTGLKALEQIHKERRILNSLSASLKASAPELPERLEKLLSKQKELEKKAAQPSKDKGPDLKSVAAKAERIGNILFLPAVLEAENPKALRETADKLRDILGPGAVLALAAAAGGKALLLTTVGKEVPGGLKAGEMIAKMAAAVGGKGGGRPDLAQAGGPDVNGIDEALKAARSFIQS